MHWIDQLPDSYFPLFTASLEGDGLLINVPHRGNGLLVHCRTCDREGWFSGRDICLRMTGWLDRPAREVAAALRCEGCNGRRLACGYRYDPGSSGYQGGTGEEAKVVWARRLDTWLREAGTSIGPYRDVLKDLPAPGAFEARS